MMVGQFNWAVTFCELFDQYSVCNILIPVRFLESSLVV